MLMVNVMMMMLMVMVIVIVVKNKRKRINSIFVVGSSANTGTHMKVP